MALEMFDIRGKTAIVTGGYRGIGRGIADGLAEAGADLVIAARHLEQCKKACSEIQKEFGVKALPFKCDISKVEDTENLAAFTEKEFGKIDVLFNNAGISGERKGIMELTDEEWHKTMGIDLKGTFNCCRAVTRSMIKQNSGKIINVAASIYMKGDRYCSDFTAAKGGVVALTLQMAVEVTRFNITVNCICPGVMDTGSFAKHTEYMDFWVPRLPLKRDV